MYADDDLQKLRCCSSPLQNNNSAEAFPHALNSEDALTFCFSHQQNIPSLKSSSSCPPIFSPFILIPLSAFEPPGFLPLQHRNPLPSAWKTHPPLFLLHLRGQLTLFSFQLASPPRIHMDSWWAARNPNQGPKWAHNISQNRSGAYGLEPCRIWVPKLPKSVSYTS